MFVQLVRTVNSCQNALERSHLIQRTVATTWLSLIPTASYNQLVQNKIQLARWTMKSRVIQKTYTRILRKKYLAENKVNEKDGHSNMIVKI